MISCNLWMAVVSFAFHVSSSNTLIWLFDKQFFIRELLSMFTFDSNAPTSPSYFQKKKKKKIQEQEQQQCGVTDEAEPFMGSGRFGNLILVYFSLFYPLLSSLLYIYDLPKLFLYHLIVMYMWQHELICWDIIVLMKRSWKLLWGFAEPNTAHILADAFTASECQNFTFWMFKVCLIQTIMFYVI